MDRLEGRPPQQLNLNNITGELDYRSDDELRFFLENGRWPESDDVLSTEQAAEVCEPENVPSK